MDISIQSHVAYLKVNKTGTFDCGQSLLTSLVLCLNSGNVSQNVATKRRHREHIKVTFKSDCFSVNYKRRLVVNLCKHRQTRQNNEISLKFKLFKMIFID